jgi:hypothetical protein
MMTSLSLIDDALDGRRFETARRLCLKALTDISGDPKPVQFRLHKACRQLGDIKTCRWVLNRIVPADEVEQREVNRLFAGDYDALGRGEGFRTSEEAAAGLTWEQYQDKYRKIAAEYRAKAGPDPAALAPKAPLEGSAPAGSGTVAGVLTFPDGRPAGNVTVTLGLKMTVREPDPATFMSPDMGYVPHIEPQSALTTRTDDHGAYRFEGVPADRHEFLSVTLNPQEFDIVTRFLVQGVTVTPGQVTRLDAVVDEWHSAPAREVLSPFPAEGRLAELVLKNPFHYDFPRQIISLPVPASERPGEGFQLFCSTDPRTRVPFQISGGDILFFADLPARTDRVFALYAGRSDALPAMVLQDDGVLDTGRAAFRLPVGTGAEALPPLMAVRGEDGVWRGTGRLRLPPGITVRERRTEVLESGALRLVVRVAYTLSNGAAYAIQFTAHQGEAYLLARETSDEVAGAAFEFSLSEFAGGRGFLHWTPEHGNVHWQTLLAVDCETARLQESVPWWIPPCGFGYAMTADGLAQRDYIGVFTLRRGDWVDRAFARISQGPGDAPPERREMDWPFPEMVGSTLSMITAHTDKTGDAFFRFGLFDGERQWGILVSTLERNDGPWKEISAVQHKNSSPRLQDFKDWRLDEVDALPRPHVVARRHELRALRRKTESPVFAPIWKRITSGPMHGPAAGLRAAVEGDPLVAWRKKRELVSVAQVRSRMTLMGRDFGDMYSPVGARPITPWAEEYDLIAASGAFTADEERLVRQFLMLMGHLYMEPDLMNWRYGSRNANFEADRSDVVGTIGVAFTGNPDAEMFVRHAVELMERSINVYGTPGSGRWYENPACYYLHASKCRSNLIVHLANHGIAHPTQWPRWKDVLGWGVLLLTPPCPHDYTVMRDGTDDYDGVGKVRRVSPIGDHAHLGPWMPEHYALMSRLYRGHDDAFADLLLWAYQAGGSNGGYFGNLPLLFATLEESDLRPAPAPVLPSRRLEGFGAAFRGHFEKQDEFFLLLMQGPGGYRYHRTEGSLLLFADGKPLIYDCGEAGETWRHTTLSFGEAHLPLAGGHVERFHSFDALDFCQGVHPDIVRPGEPIFLCDRCDHDLVDLAERRFVEPNPADSRSVLWVKDDYVILHDELKPGVGAGSHWHLQAVAQGETGNAHDGWTFRGRFGTDLQVLMPDQKFVEEQIETVAEYDYKVPAAECFAMRHLKVTGRDPQFYLAVLRPLPRGRTPVQATVLDNGVGVSVKDGKGLDDALFFSRKGCLFREGDLRFDGQYGAVLKRSDRLDLVLLAGRELQAAGYRVSSTGPAVHLRIAQGHAEVIAEGAGRVVVEGSGRTVTLDVLAATGRQCQAWKV